MARSFQIGVNTAEEVLANPPPQFRHLNLIFAPFAVRVGKVDYPAPVWTDFAGVFLFRWYRAVWKLAEDQSRFAQLPFWYTYEIWLRRTARQWWRLSLVERHPDAKNITHEALVIPEAVEAALLTAISKLLFGAKRAGIWTEDCAALDALLKRREGYLEGLEAGSIRPPRFLSGTLSGPGPTREELRNIVWKPSQHDGSPLPRSDGVLPPPLQRRINPPPFLCPRCSAVLQPWEEGVWQQNCVHCGERISL